MRTHLLLALTLLVPSGTAAAQSADPYALSALIDKYVDAKITAAGAVAAPLADDDEHLRRVYLDVAGRIPRVSEVHAFRQDNSPDKRRKLVERILAGPAHTNHFVNIFRALMLPEASASFEGRFLQPGFEVWLRQKLSSNTPYDAMVRELLSTPLANSAQDRNVLNINNGPLSFYSAKEAKPENLAAASARMFLGVQLDCAQCHNHPFANWTREQFWQQAAFFSGIERQGENLFSPLREITDRTPELQIPLTEKVVQATFLDDTEPVFKYKISPRVTFAEWVTSPTNPFFARTAANRIWAHFFGTGIIDPVDDFHDENPPSHPELLDAMAKALVAAKFDLRFLVKAITASKAYQRSSVRTHDSQDNRRLFARMAVRGLTPEQLFDSLATATGYVEDAANANPFTLNPTAPRQEFLTKFALQTKATEAQTSIIQALALMNGQFVAGVTSIESSRHLSAVLNAPFLSADEKIEALYLATLTRKPSASELARLRRHVETGDAKKRMADVFWVLLNSAEFRVNH